MGDVEDRLDQLIRECAKLPPPEFPHAYYDEFGHRVVFHFNNNEYYADWIDHHLELYRDFGTKSICGGAVWCDKSDLAHPEFPAGEVLSLPVLINFHKTHHHHIYPDRMHSYDEIMELTRGLTVDISEAYGG